MAGIFGEFFLVSVSHKMKHENSSKNSGKIRSKIRGKTRDEISKNSGNFRPKRGLVFAVKGASAPPPPPSPQIPRRHPRPHPPLSRFHLETVHILGPKWVYFRPFRTTFSMIVAQIVVFIVISLFLHILTL